MGTNLPREPARGTNWMIFMSLGGVSSVLPDWLAYSSRGTIARSDRVLVRLLVHNVDDNMDHVWVLAYVELGMQSPATPRRCGPGRREHAR
jgi:hypothetical protein